MSTITRQALIILMVILLFGCTEAARKNWSQTIGTGAPKGCGKNLDGAIDELAANINLNVYGNDISLLRENISEINKKINSPLFIPDSTTNNDGMNNPNWKAMWEKSDKGERVYKDRRFFVLIVKGEKRFYKIDNLITSYSPYRNICVFQDDKDISAY